MNDNELLVKLFFGDENVNKGAFTKLMELVHHGHVVRLHFELDCVSAVVKGLNESLVIYNGQFHYDIGGDK